jgi:hypothetical protein
MDKNKSNPILDAKEIQKMVENNTKSILKDIMEEGIRTNMKKMIKESDDDDEYEEEVEVEETPVEDTDTDTPVEDGVDDVDDVDIEGGEGEEDDFSEFEVDDETLDLTDASDEDLIKVFKKVQDDTEVEVKRTEGGVEVSDNETGAEYIIDLDGLDEANLGYTTKYQRPTGIDIPSGKGFKGNKPLGDKSSPNKDSSRNYGTKIGDGKPFNENEEINLDETEEIEEEKARTMNRRYRAGVLPQQFPKQTDRTGDYVRIGAQLEPTKGSSNESKISKIEKELKTLKEENIILKECVRQFKEAAQSYYVTSHEVAMTNCKLAKAINLFTENATTLEEKRNILERLQNCKTEQEINSLHESIKTELKSKQPLLEENIDKGFEGQEKTVAKKPIFVNEDVQRTLGLMNRVMSVRN